MMYKMEQIWLPVLLFSCCILWRGQVLMFSVVWAFLGNLWGIHGSGSGTWKHLPAGLPGPKLFSFLLEKMMCVLYVLKQIKWGEWPLRNLNRTHLERILLLRWWIQLAFLGEWNLSLAFFQDVYFCTWSHHLLAFLFLRSNPLLPKQSSQQCQKYECWQRFCQVVWVV